LSDGEVEEDRKRTMRKRGKADCVCVFVLLCVGMWVVEEEG
jgi:hypothetical protein